MSSSLDQDTLVTLYRGWDESIPGQITSSSIYLQKTTLDGQPVWLRRYEIPDSFSFYPYNIISSASGYLIFGIKYHYNELNYLDHEYFILATDKAGHIQTNSRLPVPPPFHSAGFGYSSYYNDGGDNAIKIDDYFYFSGTFIHYIDNYSSAWDFSEAFLIKSDLSLTSLDSCPFAPLGLTIVETSITNPTATPIPLTITPSTATVQNFTMYTAPDSAVITTTCARCDAPCGPILSLGPDQEFFQDTSVLLQAGAGYISYRWQDGSTAPTYLAAAGGTYWVEVKDGCGFVQRDTVQLSVNETVCDSKTQACIKWDLLDVKRTATGDLIFRVKVTNNCTSTLQKVDFQVPNGLVATYPADQSTYTAPSSGRTYQVRSPNFSPFYALRFRAEAGTSMSNGASDIFTYHLPNQADPAYIHTAATLADGSSYEAFLNTFNCPPASAGARSEKVNGLANSVLSPNPSSGTLWLHLPDWKNQAVQVRILNTQGQVVQAISLADGEETRAILLSTPLANGLYYAVVQAENEVPLTLRFVLAR